MAASTPQTQAIALANQILGINQQIADLLQQVNAALTAWNDIGAANVLNALPTAPLNADGSFGAADGAPNNAHPINTALVPTLNRAISGADLSAIVAFPLTNFQAMCNGQAIAAIGGLRQIINKAAGG